jgi:hypothetical protein
VKIVYTILVMGLIGVLQLGCATAEQLDGLALSAVETWNRADEAYVAYKDEVPREERTHSFDSYLDIQARKKGYPDGKTLKSKAWGNLSTEERLEVMSKCTIGHVFLTYHRLGERRK